MAFHQRCAFKQLPCFPRTLRGAHQICERVIFVYFTQLPCSHPASQLSPDSKGSSLYLAPNWHQIISSPLYMYCSVHVLYPAPLLSSDSKGSPSERNRVLLQQVEGRGTTAVALFVNALRQSGQLHLASSLDTEQRIRPSTSGGYFGKGRHKGWFSPYWFFDLEI